MRESSNGEVVVRLYVFCIFNYLYCCRCINYGLEISNILCKFGKIIYKENL